MDPFIDNVPPPVRIPLAVPFKIYFHERIRHRCAYGKSIDPGDRTVDRIIRAVSDAVGSVGSGGQAGDQAGQKLRFVHSCIVGAHSLMSQIDRTIEELDVFVFDRRTQCMVDH